MKLTSITCRACGGPIEIADDAGQVTCPFCGTRMAVERDGEGAAQAAAEVSGAVKDAGAAVSGAVAASASTMSASVTAAGESMSGAVTAAGESMSAAVLGAGQGTSTAIRENSAMAEAALDRLTASQRLLSIETQLTSVQSEIRALARAKETSTTRQQLRELRARETELKAELGAARAGLERRAAATGVSPAEAVPGAIRKTKTRRSRARGRARWAAFSVLVFFGLIALLARSDSVSASSGLWMLGIMFAFVAYVGTYVLSRLVERLRARR